MPNKNYNKRRFLKSGEFMVGGQWGHFECYRIEKKEREYRDIYSIDEKSKTILRSYIPYLQKKVINLDRDSVIFGFVTERNCALNALMHAGNKYTLSIDIKDFFPSVSPYHLKGLISQKLIGDCFLFGAPQQGLPTSPMIANLAFTPCDKNIINALEAIGVDCVYTRYADDLTFSFDDKRNAPKIKHAVQQILDKKGFNINHKKTKLQSLRNGRIIINGIGVDEHGIHPSRATKKKYRAAVHQGNLRSARGLREWAKCKLPNRMVE